jgi:hypothetical protein
LDLFIGRCVPSDRRSSLGDEHRPNDAAHRATIGRRWVHDGRSTLTRLTRSDIRRLFELLDSELGANDVHGEVYVVGGAVMCLAFAAREAPRHVDALFKPTRLVREAAARVAADAGVPETWLNDAVKGYLSPRAEFDRYLELPHLEVFVARPRYLLAMKCAAMRLGEEFHDLDDVRYLLRYLNISSADEALAIVWRYFDEAQLLPKTRLVLEELLSG